MAYEMKPERIAIAEARCAEGEVMRYDQTHYANCWAERGHHECAKARITELEAELSAVMAYAERYQWLRDVHTHHFTVTRVVGALTVPRYDGATLDAAIDKVRGEKWRF